MSEIKTCEQYVLQKLEINDATVCRLEGVIREKDKQIEDLKNELQGLKKLIWEEASINTSNSGSKYISIASQWESYDREGFELLKKILDEKEEDE